MKNKFTKQQIEDWKAYEEVRQGGRWNMFDNRAISASGLSKNDYLFVMENYSVLKEAAAS